MAFSFFKFPILFAVLVAGAVYFEVPDLLFPRSPGLRSDVQCKKDDHIVEALLTRYQEQIGTDYLGYRNHVYRVWSLVSHLVNNEANELQQKSFSRFGAFVKYALVYHDIALWTDKQVAYLEPSIARALSDLPSFFDTLRSLDADVDEYSDEDRRFIHNLITEAIYWHHKITPFTPSSPSPFSSLSSSSSSSSSSSPSLSPSSLSSLSFLVNAVRRSDWYDASLGVVHFGFPSSALNLLTSSTCAPNEGFHSALMEFAAGKRLHGWNFVTANVELSSIMKW